MVQCPWGQWGQKRTERVQTSVASVIDHRGRFECKRNRGLHPIASASLIIANPTKGSAGLACAEWVPRCPRSGPVCAVPLVPVLFLLQRTWIWTSRRKRPTVHAQRGIGVKGAPPLPHQKGLRNPGTHTTSRIGSRLVLLFAIASTSCPSSQWTPVLAGQPGDLCPALATFALPKPQAALAKIQSARRPEIAPSGATRDRVRPRKWLRGQAGQSVPNCTRLENAARKGFGLRSKGGMGGGGGHDCLKLAAPIGLSPLTFVVSLNPFPPWRCASGVLSF